MYGVLPGRWDSSSRPTRLLILNRSGSPPTSHVGAFAKLAAGPSQLGFKTAIVSKQWTQLKVRTNKESKTHTLSSSSQVNQDMLTLFISIAYYCYHQQQKGPGQLRSEDHHLISHPLRSAKKLAISRGAPWPSSLPLFLSFLPRGRRAP